MTNFKSRFCPSPTGLMHLGNLRTALFNALLARSHQAKGEKAVFLLRIEDTDLARSQTQFSDKLMFDLKWLGLDWQEGPQCGGDHEPYYQSERVGIYDKYYDQLLKEDKAYWCYCTETELAISRKNQLNAGHPPRYDGSCRHLTPAQVAAKKAKGIVPALRFRIPDNQMVEFVDFIQGPKSFATNDIGDFIIKKADDSASFMFCNAVDDALMGVTHVMRGEDHLTNTPRQLLILQSLSLPKPQYGHMPLITGFDGKPLSKRNGSQSIEDLREKGYFPQAIVNYLSRLGHHFEEETLLPLSELGKHFLVTHIGRSPARFDLVQLNHWQKEVVLQKTDEELAAWLKPYLQDSVKPQQMTAFIEMVKQNVVLPADAEFWAKQLLTDEVTFSQEAQDALKAAGESTLNEIEEAIRKEGANYKAVTTTVSNQTGLKGKALFLPLRAAITGACNGPELAKIFSLMGSEALIQQLGKARKSLSMTTA